MADTSTAPLDLPFADTAAGSGPIAGPVPPQLPALAELDWSNVATQLDEAGFAKTPPLLSPEQCRQMIDVRTSLYPPLAQVANRWAALLGERTFPTDLDGLLAECAEAGQHRPTPLVLRYGPGGYNCLHQDVYGDLTFPLQVLFMLNTPDEDFTGGESVFVEQRPRQQSRPMVARPGLGQAVIFPVRNRPKRGARGYHRVQMRHGVSAVHSGDRHVLGVIFHNAR